LPSQYAWIALPPFVINRQTMDNKEGVAAIDACGIVTAEGREATTNLLLSLGLMRHQARKIVTTGSTLYCLFNWLSQEPVSEIMTRFGLTHVSVMKFANLLYFMKAENVTLFGSVVLDDCVSFFDLIPSVNESVFFLLETNWLYRHPDQCP
jgi:hypothetical protein